MRIRLAFGALCAALIVSGCGSGAASPSPTAAATATVAGPAAIGTSSQSPTSAASATSIPSPTGSGVPAFRHIYVIVMENKEYGSIVGSSGAPYLNSLIARYGLATKFYGELHPSEPNYIAMTSGGLQGTTTDGTYNLTVRNLFDQIDSSGRTWRVYAQGYPGSCYKGSIAAVVTDGPGSPGEYVRKHNPAISYTSISGDQTRCSNITRLDGFDPAAADFEFIVPNQINDMHSSSTSAGDSFLKTFVPEITGSPAFTDSVLFITWDEGDNDGVAGGHIATIAITPNMTPGSRQDTATNHYSMLRTIELAWGLPLLGEAQKATALTFPW
jgi:hypothetical protein